MIGLSYKSCWAGWFRLIDNALYPFTLQFDQCAASFRPLATKFRSISHTLNESFTWISSKAIIFASSIPHPSCNVEDFHNQQYAQDESLHKWASPWLYSPVWVYHNFFITGGAFSTSHLHQPRVVCPALINRSASALVWWLYVIVPVL